MNKFTQPGKLKEVTGSITTPELSSLRLIVVPCSLNDKFETDLQKVLVKRWAKVREEYKHWFSVRQNFKLGSTNTLAVASDTWCVYLLCKNEDGTVDTKALEDGFKKLAEMAKYEKASVHLSEFTLTELPQLRKLAQELIVQEGLNVVIYTEAK